jgi:hypothetical protein
MFQQPQDISNQAVSLSLQAIQEDLRAVASWEKRKPTLIESGRLPFRERGDSDTCTLGTMGAADGVGRRLLRRCGADAEQRLLTLLHLEQSLQPEHDHGVLIAFSSQLVESVLVRLVADQLRPRAARLVEVLQVHPKDARAAEVVARWSSGQMSTTLGTIINLLLALRRAEELNLADVHECSARLFSERFIQLLRGKELAQTLNQVRDQYRNPAAHGLRAFNAREYEAFGRLVVARARFRAWDLWGADPPDPPSHEAVFHHHLAGYRWPDTELPAVPPNPLHQLLALQTLPDSLVRIDLRVEPDAGSRLRDVRPEGTGMEPAFHLGIGISITLQAEPDAYGLLLDVGTSGSVAVLWPNRWDSEDCLQAGRPVQIPGPHCPHALTLQRATGQEQLIALASLDPWRTDWRPRGDEAFRELTPADLDRLLKQFAEHPPNRRSATRLAFRVLG